MNRWYALVPIIFITLLIMFSMWAFKPEQITQAIVGYGRFK